MNTSFVALGQMHDDDKALEAAFENLKTLHKELEQKGGELVLANERASGEELETERQISERLREGLMLTYIQKAKQDGRDPNGDEFAKDNTLPVLIQMENDFSKLNRKELETLLGEELDRLRTYYKHNAFKAEQGNNKDMGPSRVVEARIYLYALKNGITVGGLDPITNQDKAELAGEGGNMSPEVLENMEYHRSTGMAENASKLMSGLANRNGGCVVAINMGPAHFGSLELALHEANQQNPKLKDAAVKMCMLLGDTKEKAEELADKFLAMSPDEMLRAHARTPDEVVEYGNDLAEAQLREYEINTVIQKFEILDKGELNDLAKDPAKFHAQLWGDATHEEVALDLETFKGALTLARQKFADGKHETFAGALREQGICPSPKDLQSATDDVENCQKWLEKAQELVGLQRGSDEFARRVQQRLASKPEGVFVVGTKEGADYSHTVHAALQDATGHHRQTVGDVLHPPTNVQEPLTTAPGQRTLTTRERMAGNTTQGGDVSPSAEEKVGPKKPLVTPIRRQGGPTTGDAAHIARPGGEAATTGEETKVKTAAQRPNWMRK